MPRPYGRALRLAKDLTTAEEACGSLKPQRSGGLGMADLTGEATTEARPCTEPSPIPMCIGIETATHGSLRVNRGFRELCTNTDERPAAQNKPAGKGLARGLVGGHIFSTCRSDANRMAARHALRLRSLMPAAPKPSIPRTAAPGTGTGVKLTLSQYTLLPVLVTLPSTVSTPMP